MWKWPYRGGAVSCASPCSCAVRVTGPKATTRAVISERRFTVMAAARRDQPTYGPACAGVSGVERLDRDVGSARRAVAHRHAPRTAADLAVLDVLLQDAASRVETELARRSAVRAHDQRLGVSGAIPLDHVPFDHGGVARRERRGNAVALLDRGHVRRVVDDHPESRGLYVLDPLAATAAGRALVHRENGSGRARRPGAGDRGAAERDGAHTEHRRHQRGQPDRAMGHGVKGTRAAVREQEAYAGRASPARVSSTARCNSPLEVTRLPA